jgi:SAM-dependent methyltransferase
VAARVNRAYFGKTQKPLSGSSSSYWESRYASGGNSGVGSYTQFAMFKAEVLNKFVAEHTVQSVIEFGCGDGNQLKLAAYPRYLGLDVSETIVAKCRKVFAGDESKRFALMAEYQGEKMSLALSLDVIYHLVEDAVFEEYMRLLFESSNRYAIIYSSNNEYEQRLDWPHVRHRKFSEWIECNAAGWKLIQHIPNRFPFKGDYTKGSVADFFMYERA